MPTHTVFVKPDGTICGVSSPITVGLGLPSKRASHVEPVNRALRFMFHVIRSRVSDNSWLAKITRMCPCQWRVRILDSGTILGPFNKRSKAIDAEVALINRKLGQS